MWARSKLKLSITPLETSHLHLHSSVHLTCCLLLIGGGQCLHYLEHLVSLMELLSPARVRELRTESGGVLPAYIRSLTLQTARTLTEHSENEFLWWPRIFIFWRMKEQISQWITFWQLDELFTNDWTEILNTSLSPLPTRCEASLVAFKWSDQGSRVLRVLHFLPPQTVAQLVPDPAQGELYPDHGDEASPNQQRHEHDDLTGESSAVQSVECSVSIMER